MSYELVRGCIPCNFECYCCQEIYSRCSAGVEMYYKGDFNDPDYVLCEYCYSGETDENFRCSSLHEHQSIIPQQ